MHSIAPSKQYVDYAIENVLKKRYLETNDIEYHSFVDLFDIEEPHSLSGMLCAALAVDIFENRDPRDRHSVSGEKLSDWFENVLLTKAIVAFID